MDSSALGETTSDVEKDLRDLRKYNKGSRKQGICGLKLALLLVMTIPFITFQILQYFQEADDVALVNESDDVALVNESDDVAQKEIIDLSLQSGFRAWSCDCEGGNEFGQICKPQGETWDSDGNWCYLKGGLGAKACSGAKKSAEDDRYWSKQPCTHRMSLGCWKDTRNRIHSVQLKSSLGLDACQTGCQAKGSQYVYMSYQYQKDCFCGTAGDDHEKYGKSTGCANGLGGTWAADVYQIGDVETPATPARN